MERQRDEGLEPAGFILKLAQPEQVIQAVFRGLDVAVEHGAVGMQAHLVRDAGGIDPLLAGQLVIADDAPHAIVKDFGAAAGQGIHAGVFQALQHFALADLAALREIADLDHGEGFQVHLRKALLQAAQHLAVPIESQLRMQAAHDVKFGDGFAVALAGLVPDLFERHRVRLGIALLLAERAQLATGHADIGGIDVAVDVEVSLVAVQALADLVRQPADAQQIRSAVNRQAVLVGQPLAGVDLGADRFEASVFKRGSHQKDRVSCALGQNTQENDTIVHQHVFRRLDHSAARPDASGNAVGRLPYRGALGRRRHGHGLPRARYQAQPAGGDQGSFRRSGRCGRAPPVPARGADGVVAESSAHPYGPRRRRI